MVAFNPEYVASLLLDVADLPDVCQNRLGHSSIKVTLDSYGHLFDGLDEAAAERLDATFSMASAGSALKLGQEEEVFEMSQG